MEISAQSIQIQKNQGLTQALRAHVGKDAKISAQQWDRTIDTLIKINEDRKASGAQTIFTGGTDKSKAAYHTSFVVKPDQKIDFSQDEMKELYSAMGISLGETAKEVDKTEKLEEVNAVPEEKEAAKEEGLKPEVNTLADEKLVLKADKKALKAKMKKEKAHDRAAIKVTVPRGTTKRRKTQSKFDKANKALISMAYNTQKPYIKEGVKVINGVEYTTKTAKFDNGARNNTWAEKAYAEARKFLHHGDRYVTALYDKKGELVGIEINSDMNRKNNEPDVLYTKNAAYADTKRKQAGYESVITEGYDFEAVKAVTDKIFAKESI